MFDNIQEADDQIKSKKASSEYALLLQPALFPARVLPAALLIGEYGSGGEWVEGFMRLGDQKDQSGLVEKQLEFRAKHLCISKQYVLIFKTESSSSKATVLYFKRHNNPPSGE
ncbi:hypothetical protein BY996DRAFT_6408907 [Phakopsora pachyrhizi]|nr:hypothetical protein BY996DRAFT_6408907 [Phakopsora pachyrhizi]